MSHLDPKILALAFLGGIIPALLWLYFWINEEEERPEPKRVLSVVFIMGMIAVVCTLPIERFIQIHILSNQVQIVLWATTEEILKFIATLLIVYKTNFIEEPIEWPIYLITAALGFAALENALFILKPLSLGQNTLSLLTGGIRFLGSTLLHSISSGIIGIGLGISLHFGKFKKFIYAFIGLIFAITLHSVFNFFIMKNEGTDFLKVLGLLWVVTIIVMLLFEKVRRME